MTQPYRITDLSQYTQKGSTLTGAEVAELSDGGNGSYQAPLAVLACSRTPLTVSSGATVTISASQYGDILVTTTSAVVLNLPLASARAGVPVSVIAQTTSTPNITINRSGSDTILGNQTALTITNPYGSYTLWPTSSDWYQK